MLRVSWVRERGRPDSNRRCGYTRAAPASRGRVNSCSACVSHVLTIARHERLRRLRADLRRLVGGHDRGRPLLRRARTGGGRAARRARGRHRPGRDPGRARDRPARARNRLVPGDARAGARAQAAADVDLELREGDMRELELDEPAGLIYCPRPLAGPPPDLGRPAPRLRAGRTRRSSPAAASPGTSSSSTRGSRWRIDGEWQEQNGVRAPDRPRQARQPDRHHARERRRDLALVAQPLRVGRPDRASRASRSRRSTAASSAEPFDENATEFVWVVRKPVPYDPIARIYDPWSASVTEDVEFYVEEARAAGGPSSSSACGTGRISVPIAKAGVR